MSSIDTVPTRHFFGIPQRGPQVRGNDPLDYEQKFPEDERYQELGFFARVWRTYLEECGAFDIQLLEGWRDGVDVLLVFAGLFSAVVTTFVVQTSQNLQVNYGQVTATLLFELIDIQRAAANGSLVNDVPHSNLTPFSDFHPTISDSLINGLWFTSLSFSLATALFAVLTKQWIHQYTAVPSGTPRDKCYVRQFRYMGLEQWGVGFIIGLLPFLLSASLGIFLVGLVLFLVPLQRVIASIVGTITFATFAIYFISNVLPIWFPSCPYKTPLSEYIFLFYTYIIHLITLVSSVPKKPLPKFQDVEDAAVKLRADDLNVSALAWLSNISSNPSVQNIVMHSTSVLPLWSVGPLKRSAQRFSEMFETPMTITGDDGNIDRLIRVHLRFGTSIPKATIVNRTLSAETAAEALCVDFTINNVASLIETQLQMRSPSDKRLCLQPIVWAGLLQKLVPFTRERRLIPLFLMIPSCYWSANYNPPPLYPENGMKIRSISYQDHRAITLAQAVNSHLYPDIANAFFEGFRDVKDSLFHADPTANGFPAPSDQRLHLLLILASSPSIPEDVFGTVISKILTFIGVNEPDLLDNNSPSFKLDANRCSVLKVLYTLISSNEFGGPSMRNPSKCITLVAFLRVLQSTSPHPRFLPKDWCTPSMAYTFAEILLPGKESWERHFYLILGRDHKLLSDKLILYFLGFPPVRNEIFSHFVSGHHLDKYSGVPYDNLRLGFVSQILDTFIVQMTSDALDPQVFQQFKTYIFKPENLFIICAVHICCDHTYYPGLRRLAQVHRDHPAWPECLRMLDAMPLAEQFLWSSVDADWIAGSISEFRKFVDGGCVGSFGPHTSDPQALVEDEHPVNELSKLKKSLWHRLQQWQRHDSAANAEDIMMTTTNVSAV